MHRRTLLAATAAALTTPALAQAQWPDRPLRVIIPWPPGQATDLVGRLYAQKIGEALGVNVVPENRAGAGGQIGTDAAAKAAPDGYTLLAGSAGPVTFAPLVQRTPYDVERDRVPVAMTTNSPYMLVMKPGFPATDMAGFIREVKSKPGKYTFGTSGTGAAAHMIAAWFNHRAGLDVVHVPFAGSIPALTNVMGGSVDYCIETFAATMPLVRQGQLKALGCSLVRGTYLAPEIQPFSQLPGLEGFDAGAWGGLMVPARTPEPIVKRLSEIMASMRSADVREQFTRLGVEQVYHDAAGFAAFLHQQKTQFAEVVRTANIKLD